MTQCNVDFGCINSKILLIKFKSARYVVVGHDPNEGDGEERERLNDMDTDCAFWEI